MNKYFKIFAEVFIFITLFVFINRLVAPKYIDSLVEGSLTSDYYKSGFNHDVLIFGDCEVYSNISPDIMFETTGILAYNRANAQQMMWQSYYLLQESLVYETPKVIMLSVGGLRNGVKDASEAYNRLAIDKMKWSSYKVDMINASKTKDETIFSYMFPILRYHSRIDSLTNEDLKYLFEDTTANYSGYIINTKTVPYTNWPVKRELSDYRFDEKSVIYFDNFVQLCKKKGITLILFKAPSLYPYWYDEWDNWVDSYAKDNGIVYLNYNYNEKALGLDYQTDTYDGGMHLNYNGAYKLSTFIANQLTNLYGLESHKGDPYYQRKLFAFQDAVIKSQESN